MFLTTLSPSRTVVTSFSSTTSDYEQGDWVLCLASSSSTTTTTTNTCHGGHTVSCALSNGTVQVYDQQRLHLLSSYDASFQSGHLPIIHDLCYGPGGTTLLAVGPNGTMAVFDIRQQQEQQQRPVLQTAALPWLGALETVSLGCGSTVAAVGSNKGKIHFFDLRNVSTVLGTYGDSHTDAISQVVFSSWESSMLLSGSEDGLACCFDTRQPTEELATKSVLNVGTPLRQVGFCGDYYSSEAPKTVFLLTGSETASLWDWETAHCLQTFGGLQLRQQLTQTLAKTTVEQPSLPPFTVDYLIDAHWDMARRELILATGNTAGEGALFRLSSETPDQWHAHQFLKGGHRGVIRAWCPLTESVSLSAGEDARLVEWDSNNNSSRSVQDAVGSSGTKTTHGVVTNHHRLEISGCALAPTTQSSVTGVRAGGPLRRQQQKRHKVSSSPY